MNPAAATDLATTVIPTFGKPSRCVAENHFFCSDWFHSHWDSIFRPALEQHAALTIEAVVIGFAISMALALLSRRLTMLNTPITLITGLLFTIPSAMLFQILIPTTGTGRLTVEIPLVSYTLLILYRNIVTGLSEVPDEVKEAAQGMGLTSRQVLLRVELPLAVPAIIAGLRTATATVISLAAIAGVFIDQGLGAPIYTGIQTGGGFNVELFSGAVLAIALAIVGDGILVGIQRLVTPWARAQRA